MIKSWIFEFFPPPAQQADDFDAASSQRHFNAYLDLWVSAECAGFDGIFFSEHHFGGGYSPAPHLLIASLAQRTSRLRLGVMGVVPPYHTPWQLVEEIGMLDHLTCGRLEIGTAAGIPQEMAHIGLGVDEARARNDEAIEILDKALAEPVISHHGTFWNFDNLRLTPRPVQQPIPIWVTANPDPRYPKMAERALRRVAKYGDGWMTTGNTPASFAANLAAIRRYASEEARNLGPNFEACLYYNINVNENREGAFQESKKFLDTYYSTDYPRFYLENWVALGSPQQCIDHLKAFIDAGATTITLRITDYDQEHQFERVTKEVLAALM